MKDVKSNVKVFQLYGPADDPADGDGPIVDITGYNGRGQAFVDFYEDGTSQATSKTIDITIHNVQNDSEATASSNQVAAFTQLACTNTSTATHQTGTVAVDLNALDGATPKKYLQAKVNQTNSPTGPVSVVLLVNSDRYPPVS